MDEGKETVRLIEEAGGEAIFVQADVTKEADVKAMVDKQVLLITRSSQESPAPCFRLV